MKRIFVILISGMIVAFMFGCGEAKIDGSSKAAFEKSFDAMVKTMPKDEAKRVFGKFASVMLSEVTRSKNRDNPYIIFDGMTKSELIKYLEERTQKK